MGERGVRDQQAADEETGGWEEVKNRKKDRIPCKKDSVIVINEEGKTYS